MVSADCSTNGSCIWPEPNSSPTVCMPRSRSSLTIASGSFSFMPSSRSASMPVRSPSMMRCAKRSNSGIAASFSARASLASAADTPSKSSMKVCSGS